jgi:hypothetical protein
MIHYCTLRPPQNAQHYTFRTSRLPQITHMWTDRKKAIIVLDDAGRVIRVDINASKFTLNYTVYIKWYSSHEMIHSTLNDTVYIKWCIPDEMIPSTLNNLIYIKWYSLL